MKIKELYGMEKAMHQSSLLIKIYLGQIINQLLVSQRWKQVISILKENGVFYSRGELSFARRIYVFCDQYPKFRLVSLPLRTIKNNISIIEKIVENEKNFWSDN